MIQHTFWLACGSFLLSCLSVTPAYASTPSVPTPVKIASLSEPESQIDVSRVAQSVLLGANTAKNISVRMVLTDSGLSPDMGGRYSLYVNFFHAGELVNTRTAFLISRSILSVKATKRVSAGVYEITALVVTEQGLVATQTFTIDTLKVFSDDRNLAADEFSDNYFNSELTVTAR